MCAFVAPQVDALTRNGDPGEKRLDQRLVRADEREDRAVVVWIGMNVEQADAARERLPDRRDRGPVAPLREVGHRLEREHGPTLGSREGVLRGPRAGVRRLVARHGELSPNAIGPAGTRRATSSRCGSASSRPARTLDVACGTGFMTRHLRGDVVGLDQSPSMIELARSQAPNAEFVVGDALELPFDDGTFDRVFTSYFYCHLEETDRLRFLAEARRVARELVVVASVPGAGDPWSAGRSASSDGSRWQVYKRVFAPNDLARELGGRVLHTNAVLRNGCVRVTRRCSWWGL